MQRQLQTPFRPFAARRADLSSAQQWLDSGMPAAGPAAPWLPPVTALLARFALAGGLIDGDALVERLRQARGSERPLPMAQSIAQVARWIVLGDALAFAGPGGWLLPLFQFDLSRGAVRACMQPLLAELRGVFEEAELALWFVTPNTWLGERRPALEMQGNLAQVLRAARADRYVARGD